MVQIIKSVGGSRKAILLILVILAASGIIKGNIDNASAQNQNPVVIYFFWGDGCPHCVAAKPFLADLTERYPDVQVRDYEVWYTPENAEILWVMAERLDFEPQAVPLFIIGERHWTGYSEQLAGELERYVQYCLESGACTDVGAGIVPDDQFATKPVQEVDVVETPAQSPEAPDDEQEPPEIVQAPQEEPASPAPPDEPAQETRLSLPLLGAVDLGAHSLAVSTALIAFVDGFNPCSMWVLSILIALTLHTGSRKKVLIIGLVFITVTAAVYVLFIAGLFTILSFVSFLGWIQAAVAVVALFFATVNIKDYFWYKEGVSFTIADDKKPGIYQRARNILNASKSFWGMVGATVVMAAGVSLVEFSCTAGFPVLWTNLVAAQGVTPATFALLLALYMLIYQIDELGLFLIAVFTLKASKLEEKHGRILKLVGGLLMLTLAIVMLIDPSLMNELRNSLLIFGAAFVGAALILLVHRAILPRLGIHLGTEPANANPAVRRSTQRIKRA